MPDARSQATGKVLKITNFLFNVYIFYSLSMSPHRALVWCSAFTWFVISCGQIFTLLSFRFLSNLVGKDLSDQVENAQANFCGRSENNLLDKHVMDSSFVFNPGRRREDSLWWTIRGGFAQKGYLLQALGISKGRDFTSWSI